MIPWYKPHLFGQEKAFLCEALESSWISDGKYVDDFEKRLGELLNTDKVVTTSNGTTALHLAYLALGIKAGDEVIVPAFTFAAPANMAIALGATPVFADVDAETWLIDPVSVEAKITSRTKAIVPVHLYGNVCDMSALKDIARKHNIAVVEDTAEALFSRYRQQAAGTLGDVGCFSFQATKTITTGEGGAIVVKSDELQGIARLYRNHGMSPQKRYWHEVAGHNFRLTNIQAALGCAQLNHVTEIIENKERVYERYVANLSSHPGLKLQRITDDCEPVMWAIVVKLVGDECASRRDSLISELYEQGVECRPGFTVFSDMPLYSNCNAPVAKNIAATTLSLPSYTMLTDAEIDHVCGLFLAALSR